MTSIVRKAGLLACAAFTLTAAGSALAADPPPLKAGKAGKAEEKIERKIVIKRVGDGPRGMHRGDPERRAQHLRDVLQLRPDQEPALKAFLEASKPRTFERRLDLKPGEAPPERKALTTPERLDLQARRMAEHKAMFDSRAASIRAFYAALSPSQQKAFDALHEGRGGRGGPGPRRFRMDGPDGHPGPGGPGGMVFLDSDDEDVIVVSGVDIRNPDDADDE